MADSKISALPASTTPLAGTEVLPVVQSGTTKQVTVANLTAGKAVSGSSFGATVSANGSVSTGYTHNNTGSGSGVGSKLALQSSGTDVAALSWLYNGSAFSTDLKGFGSVTITPGNNGGGNTTVLTATTTDITFNVGNLIQGTAAKGVNFTANTGAAGMTSQLLNWYEEGTWTPTDTSGAGLTFTVTKAVYTRIGNTVTAFVYLTYPTTASGAAARIGGLPFTVGANNYMPLSILSDCGVFVSGYTNQSSTEFWIQDSSNASIANSTLSGKFIVATATYFV